MSLYRREDVGCELELGLGGLVELGGLLVWDRHLEGGSTRAARPCGRRWWPRSRRVAAGPRPSPRPPLMRRAGRRSGAAHPAGRMSPVLGAEWLQPFGPR